jgi:uncharacterized cupredoxin-like copper-binding protein
MAKKILLLVAVMSILLSACGGAGSSAAPSSNVSVDMAEFKFAPQEMSVFSGKETSLELKNSGAVEHDFTILKKGAIAKTPFDKEKQAGDILVEFKLGAGKEETFKFTLPEPGEYVLICNIPGHMEAGMSGKITAVQP